MNSHDEEASSCSREGDNEELDDDTKEEDPKGDKVQPSQMYFAS